MPGPVTDDEILGDAGEHSILRIKQYTEQSNFPFQTITNMAAKASGCDYSNGRELGLHEMFYEVMCGRVGTSNYFQYAVLRSNCILELKDVEESLKTLIHFQPFLRMKVVSKTEEDVRPNCRKGRENARLYYEPAEVKLEDVLRVRKSRKLDDLNEIVEEEELFLSREERYGDGVRLVSLLFNLNSQHVRVVTINNNRLHMI